jgi:uncharacterized protein YgiM (DUF1202 family)
MVFLAACGGSRKPVAKTSPAAASASAEFTFPQAKCGEESSTPSTNWYPVFIDGAELEAIRSQYCGNAISEVRSKTGAPTVQVASFTSYEKAKKFAVAVGGEVEVSGTAPSTRASATTRSDSTRRTATLSSSEPGSPINIRQRASVDASVQEVARSGDTIQVSSKTQGEDGYTWYKVELASGASGWVRSDLIDAAGSDALQRGSTDAETVASASIESSTASSTTPSTAPSTAPSASTVPSTTAAPSASTPPSTESSTTASTASSSTASTAPATRSSTASSTSATGRSAVISATDPDSPINVRSAAGTDSEVQDIAYGGDRIQITESQQGSDGQTWYKVEFESGASGWVRSDFIGR